jgi:hypothetical protein
MQPFGCMSSGEFLIVSNLKSTPAEGARHLCRINVKKAESLGIIQAASIANREAA